MSNQLIKTTGQGKENVFPRTRIQDLFDDTSGQKLIDILKSFNMMFVPYLGNKSYTRNQISPELRRQGLWLTYVIDNTVYTEWYGEVAIDDTNWGSDSNWRQGSNALVGDLSISPNGTWVINGEDSGITIKGDKGDSPVIRIYDNKIQVSYDKGATYEDLNNTPVYTKFRFNSQTNTYQVSYDLGGTWQDISDEKVYHKFRYNSTTNTYQESTDFGKTWFNISAEKVYYQFRYNEETNTHQVSTDLGQNWTDVSSNKVYYQFRTNDNRLQVSTDLGTTWENCSEPIAAWFRWADTSGTGNVGKVQISRDNSTWEDLSPNMTNNLYIKGYVAAVGNLPSNAAIGDIYMVGPTYDESDTTHDYPHYRMWVKQSSGWVDNGEYQSNVQISQTTGQETGITMSQKAITNTINKETARAKAAETKLADTINGLPEFVYDEFMQGYFHENINVVNLFNPDKILFKKELSDYIGYKESEKNNVYIYVLRSDEKGYSTNSKNCAGFSIVKDDGSIVLHRGEYTYNYEVGDKFVIFQFNSFTYNTTREESVDFARKYNGIVKGSEYTLSWPLLESEQYNSTPYCSNKELAIKADLEAEIARAKAAEEANAQAILEAEIEIVDITDITVNTGYQYTPTSFIIGDYVNLTKVTSLPYNNGAVFLNKDDELIITANGGYNPRAFIVLDYDDVNENGEYKLVDIAGTEASLNNYVIKAEKDNLKVIYNNNSNNGNIRVFFKSDKNGIEKLKEFNKHNVECFKNTTLNVNSDIDLKENTFKLSNITINKRRGTITNGILDGEYSINCDNEVLFNNTNLAGKCLNKTINIMWFGAKPSNYDVDYKTNQCFGGQDSTRFIQQAIDCAYSTGVNKVYVPKSQGAFFVRCQVPYNNQNYKEESCIQGENAALYLNDNSEIFGDGEDSKIVVVDCLTQEDLDNLTYRTQQLLALKEWSDEELNVAIKDTTSYTTALEAINASSNAYLYKKYGRKNIKIHDLWLSTRKKISNYSNLMYFHAIAINLNTNILPNAIIEKADGSNISVYDCIFHDVVQAVHINNSNYAIKNEEQRIIKNVSIYNNIIDTVTNKAIEFNSGSIGNVAYNNVVYNAECAYQCIFNVKNCKFINNRAYDCSIGISFAHAYTSKCFADGNMISNCKLGVIIRIDAANYDGDRNLEDIIITNNQIYGASEPFAFVGHSAQTEQSTGRLVVNRVKIINNIFSGETSYLSCNSNNQNNGAEAWLIKNIETCGNIWDCDVNICNDVIASGNRPQSLVELVKFNDDINNGKTLSIQNVKIYLIDIINNGTINSDNESIIIRRVLNEV